MLDPQEHEIESVKWSKDDKKFVPSNGKKEGKESILHIEPIVRLPIGPEYVGKVCVLSMSPQQIQHFFSREIFHDDYMMKKKDNELYLKVCSGIDFDGSMNEMGRNRQSVELFLNCYQVFLGMLVRIFPSHASEYLRCAKVHIKLGNFVNARQVAQLYLLSKQLQNNADAKELILQARKYENSIEQAKKRSTLANNMPQDLLQNLIQSLDDVLQCSPLSREAMHVKIAILLSAEAYQLVVDCLSSLPLFQMDIHLHLALARGLSYTGHLKQAMEELTKMKARDPLVRNEIQRLQTMQEKCTKGTALFHGGHAMEAISIFDTCLSLDPDNRLYVGEILFKRGTAFLSLTKDKEAIQDLEKCLELNPNHTQAAANLAAARAQLATSKMRNQIYKEQRAHDKHTMKSSNMNIFFQYGKPNIAARDYLKHLHDTTRQVPRETKKKSKFTSLESLPDFYTILGVTASASKDEIKKAYHRLALQVHPDKCQDDGTDEQFKAIAMAYSILSDVNTRAQYDQVYNPSFYDDV